MIPLVHLLQRLRRAAGVCFSASTTVLVAAVILRSTDLLLVGSAGNGATVALYLTRRYIRRNYFLR